ncbi:hypothetical protein R84B8_01812 [Treponema sp. R8-4-B8]
MNSTITARFRSGTGTTPRTNPNPIAGNREIIKITFQKKLEEAARLLKEAGQEIKKAGVLRLEFKITLKPQKTIAHLGMFSHGNEFSDRTGAKTAAAKK